MSAAQEFDLAVIGGGPGGYVAALRAAQIGLRTVLIEREHLGGVCLNWGCIPTKSLLHVADALRGIREAEALGIRIGEPELDFDRIMGRSREVAARLSQGVTFLLKRAGVTVVEGQASLTDDKAIAVRVADGQVRQLRAKDIILATGARARELPSLPFDGKAVWNYRDALSASDLPGSLLVIGAGAIGMEFASFYATLGTQVTVVEAQPRVLPGGDAEVSSFVAKAFEGDGIDVRTGTRIESVAVTQTGIRATLVGTDGSSVIEAERVLVAVGLVPNSMGLGLEQTNVRLENGAVVTDGWGATDEPGIYAIGDLTGAPMLAHRASHQGIRCVERIAGLHQDAAAPDLLIPACTYCHPQTASVGLTEEEASATGARLKVGRFPLEGNGKAVATGVTAGFVKTIFDADSGALLGAHIVGHDATELIHGYTLAATLEATEAELIETVFPHPTLSEAMHESVLAAFGRALHI